MARIEKVSVLVICGCSSLLGYAAESSVQHSGVYIANLDTHVRPQDDLYRYVNGRWLDNNVIPAYMSSWGISTELQVSVYTQARSILEQLVGDHDLHSSDDRKLADLYASYMDERGIEAAGLAPLSTELALIGRIDNAHDVAAVMAQFVRMGIAVPVRVDIHPDSKQSNDNVADLGQDGLSLPDRDYYLSEQPRFKSARIKYREHIERVLALTGVTCAKAKAAAVFTLETKLATAQWTNVAIRDPARTYNRYEVTALRALAPGLDWARFTADSGLSGKTAYVNVSEPSYLTALAELARTTPLAVWRAYFEWRLIDQLSRFLPKRFADETDGFYGATLSGATESRPRWLRAVGFIDDSMGDALGRLYVAHHFPPEAKEHAERIMASMLVAFRSRIELLDWMDSQTKREAQAKLAALTVKFGYPKQWREYGALHTSRSELARNVLACRSFAYNHGLEKLGKPVDRDEWDMTPLAVNGYYSAWHNEVVLPAALMQPPFFQATAEDAVNYGGLGWFIAHELSHAFDNRGSQFDGIGTLRDWMTKDAHAKFSEKTNALVNQYSRYEVSQGVFINGELTLGENIADVSGLAIAYEAYHRFSGSKASPLLDGFSDDQRFYMAFATIWASKAREGDVIARIKSDIHSPARFRVQGAVVNQDSFYAAFGVHEGDGMYVPPQLRVRIW